MKFKRFLCSAIAAATMFTSGMAMMPSMHTSAAGAISYWQGDVNGDNNIELADIIILNKYLNGAVSFNSNETTRADVNYDGIIDKADSNKIIRYNLKKETSKYVTKPIHTILSDSERDYIVHECSSSNHASIDGYYMLQIPRKSKNITPKKLQSPPDEYTEYHDGENTNVVELSYNFVQDGEVKKGFATGFIVGKHVIAASAHCLVHKSNSISNSISNFSYNMNINIYNGDYVENTPTYTYHPKSYHIPRKYNEPCDTYDYSLIYVEQELPYDSIFSLGYVTNEILDNNKTTYLVSSGYTNVNNKRDRYFNKGKIYELDEFIKTLHKLIEGKSGGITYHESSDNGSIIKSIVGICSGTGSTSGLGYSIRITPAIARFYLNNEHFTNYSKYPKN